MKVLNKLQLISLPLPQLLKFNSKSRTTVLDVLVRQIIPAEAFGATELNRWGTQ